ncbi:MAG: peroxiredoxin [Sandaracinaceae bacterium]|nr:MAG: peroxiredoxin [Sandaracinaceae bacterium]
MLSVMLRPETEAPLFRAMSVDGREVALKDLRGRIVVLYFFRRAFTRNCTVETKGFRDNYADLRAIGAEVIGVSCDDNATQCRFAEAQGVDFPMIADTDRQISNDYQTFFWLLPRVSHRVTYVIDREGTVAGVFNHEFQVSKHLDEVLRFVKELAGIALSTRPPSSSLTPSPEGET